MVVNIIPSITIPLTCGGVSLNHHTTSVWWGISTNQLGVHGYLVHNIVCVPEQEYRLAYFLYNVHLYMHVLCLYSTATCPMSVQNAQCGTAAQTPVDMLNQKRFCTNCYDYMKRIYAKYTNVNVDDY